MTLEQFKKELTNKLHQLYPLTEINSFFNLLLEDLFQCTKIDYILNPSQEINNYTNADLQNIISQLSQSVPIQYIIGFTEFMGLELNVNPNVLIPRPETELLINWIIDDYQNLSPTIIDIGTGSGCIPISLYKNIPNAQINSVDVSEAAIATAKKNADKNLANINFIHQNILQTNSFTNNYDVIVSNPPYVRELEKKEILPNVLNHEPHLALFVSDNDPLIFYRKIGELAKKHLTTNGALYFEINQYLGKETVMLLQQIGFSNVILKNDQFNNPRMIKATL